tara:strand:- start:1081 stop:1461 length:381 start_codon:yes stop_codon:yes gene_type:complete
MSEYVRVQLVVPVEIVDAANRVASIFDPDTGGANTFGTVELSSTGDAPATHYMANTLIKPQYIPMLTDSAQAIPALNQLAQLYSRTPPSEQDVLDFCTNVQASAPGADTWAFIESLGLYRVVTITQ